MSGPRAAELKSWWSLGESDQAVMVAFFACPPGPSIMLRGTPCATSPAIRDTDAAILEGICSCMSSSTAPVRK